MGTDWERDAQSPEEYHTVECSRGREFIIRMTTGADPFLGIQKFAIDNNIMFGKIHAAFMGGLQPAKYLKWIPDYVNPENWHREGVAVNTNLSMILSLSGIIHPLTDDNGKEVPFPAILFVAGGAWDTGPFGGHLEKGSRVKGVLECFITEIKDIDRLPPVVRVYDDDEYPENWYKSLL